MDTSTTAEVKSSQTKEHAAHYDFVRSVVAARHNAEKEHPVSGEMRDAEILIAMVRAIIEGEKKPEADRKPAPYPREPAPPPTTRYPQQSAGDGREQDQTQAQARIRAQAEARAARDQPKPDEYTE